MGLVKISLLLTICSIFTFCTKSASDDPLKKAIEQGPEMVQKILSDSSHEIQILYTHVNRNDQNVPILTSYSYNLSTDQYFYPASTVKMPAAFLALEKINELKKEESSIDRNAPIQFLAGTPPQSAMMKDSTSDNGYPNIALFIEKVFSVSDNNAYNRLYEFLGQDYLNNQLKSKGIFSNSKIRTRVGISGFDTESNKYTNPLQILGEDGQVIYERDEYYALNNTFPELKETRKGVGYYDSSLDTIVYEAFDMSEKNFINLVDLEASLRRIIFPELYDESERFNLTEDQYQFLYDIMPKYPMDFTFNEGHDEYYDSYVKFFYNGDSEEEIPEHIKIFNKVGWAYGTLTDCSYIIDTKNKIEFFLTATILVNENQIFNDGNYEYEEKGLPFLAGLGKAVYHYELSRKRKNIPDLSKFYQK